jgi:hypothetical protein
MGGICVDQSTTMAPPAQCSTASAAPGSRVAAAAGAPRAAAGARAERALLAALARRRAAPRLAAPLLAAPSSGRAPSRLAAAPEAAEPAAAAAAAADDAPPAGCSRYSVTLSRPLGLVLEERRAGGIVVAEVQAGGNAERVGGVGVGDELIATSARVFTKKQEYNEITVRSGEHMVRLAVRGETFGEFSCCLELPVEAENSKPTNHSPTTNFEMKIAGTVMAAIGTHRASDEVTLEFQQCGPVAA